MTRKIFSVSLMLVLAGLVAFGQDAAKTVKIKGYLIDNMCSGDPGEDKDYEAEAKGHTLSCALMPHCHKSGFAVAEGRKLYKLDDEGNKLADVALKATKGKKAMQVEVEGTLEGSTLKATKLTEIAAKE